MADSLIMYEIVVASFISLTGLLLWIRHKYYKIRPAKHYVDAKANWEYFDYSEHYFYVLDLRYAIPIRSNYSESLYSIETSYFQFIFHLRLSTLNWVPHPNLLF